VAYREEAEALRARVEQLESDLEAARATIRRLEGAAPTPAEPAGIGARIAGGPMSLELERTFDGELPESVNEDILEILRTRFGVLGNVATVGRTFSWSTYGSSPRWVEVSVARRRGKTEVRMVERLFALTGGLFGGVGGGLGGGGIGLIVPLLIVLRLGAWIAPLAILWVIMAMVIARALFARGVARRRRELARASEEITGAIERALDRRAARRILDATDRDGDAEREAEAEAEGGEPREPRVRTSR
jgi:hypothetical protein